jgi:hypothetical protein
MAYVHNFPLDAGRLRLAHPSSPAALTLGPPSSVRSPQAQRAPASARAGRQERGTPYRGVTRRASLTRSAAPPPGSEVNR